MFLPALDRRIALLPASVRRRSPAARRPLRTSTRLHEQSSTHPDKQPSDYGEGSSRLPNPPPSNPEDLSYQTADDIPRTSEPNADLGEASSSMRLRRTQGGFGLAQRPRSPPWKEKTSGDADKETLDRFLGIDKATANVSSFHRPPPKDEYVWFLGAARRHRLTVHHVALLLMMMKASRSTYPLFLDSTSQSRSLL